MKRSPLFFSPTGSKKAMKSSKIRYGLFTFKLNQPWGSFSLGDNFVVPILSQFKNEMAIRSSNAKSKKPTGKFPLVSCFVMVKCTVCGYLYNSCNYVLFLFCQLTSRCAVRGGRGGHSPTRVSLASFSLHRAKRMKSRQRNLHHNESNQTDFP